MNCRIDNAPALAIAGLLCVSCVALSIVGCSTYERPILDLVPSDSCAVIVVDWSALRTDNDLKRLFKGDQFEAVLERLGVESSAVKTMVVFSALNSRTKAGM